MLFEQTTQQHGQHHALRLRANETATWTTESRPTTNLAANTHWPQKKKSLSLHPTSMIYCTYRLFKSALLRASEINKKITQNERCHGAAVTKHRLRDAKKKKSTTTVTLLLPAAPVTITTPASAPAPAPPALPTPTLLALPLPRPPPAAAAAAAAVLITAPVFPSATSATLAARKNRKKRGVVPGSVPG